MEKNGIILAYKVRHFTLFYKISLQVSTIKIKTVYKNVYHLSRRIWNIKKEYSG